MQVYIFIICVGDVWFCCICVGDGLLHRGLCPPSGCRCSWFPLVVVELHV